MAERRFRIMLAAGAGSAADAVYRELQGGGADVVVHEDDALTRAEITARRAHAAVLCEGGGAPGAAPLIAFIRDNPATAHIPVFLVRDPSAARAPSFIPFGVAAVFDPPPQTAAHEPSGSLHDCVLRHVRALHHPVTLLPTGAVLHDLLDSQTRKTEKIRHLLIVKLMGLKAYNVHKSYDSGDAMLGSFANLLLETLVERGAHNDILGHLHASKFCVLSHDRRVETLCRSIIVKTQRHIRTYYSPFELMQGYVTVEEEGRAGNYYLAEAMIAGAEIPSGWDSPHVYVLDMLNELLKHVERGNDGYKLISL